MLEKKEIVPYKDPDLVILRNPVAKAKFGLSLVQTKILFEVIAYFKNYPESKIMRFYIRDYLNKLGLDSHNLKSYVDEIEGMTRLHLQIPEGETRKGINYLAVNLFAGARFRIDEQGFGYVDVEVSEMLKPYFLEIAKGDFFYYHIVNTRILKSTYSIKLYLLLKSYKRFRTLEMPIAELRNILEIHPDEYQRYKDFKKRILERARLELKEKNDIFFTYDEIRARPNNQKSEVIKIAFQIHDNPDSQEIRDKVKAFEKTVAAKSKLTPSQKDAYGAVSQGEMLQNTPLSMPETPFSGVSEPPTSLSYSFDDAVIEFTPKHTEHIGHVAREPNNFKTRIIELFKVFDKEAIDAEIIDFVEGLQREEGAILDVLLYAQAEQKKGNIIKSIYAYMVSGLKTNIGKGLSAKDNAKRQKSELLKKAQAEHAQIMEWIEREFRTFEMQHYYDIGVDADTDLKKDFLNRKRKEAETAPSVRARFFQADGSLKQDDLRLGLGIEMCRAKGETSETLFKQWAIEHKNVRVNKINDLWAITEELIF